MMKKRPAMKNSDKQTAASAPFFLAALFIALAVLLNPLPLPAQDEGSITPDFVKGLEKLAATGDEAALHTLGLLHFYGEGVKRDYKKSASYLSKAAEAGFPPSQSFLGYIYENGFGVKQDTGKAVSLYESAAEQDDTLAQLSLGALYLMGDKVKPDHAKAFAWLSKAAAKGDYQAELLLGEMYLEGEGVAADAAKALDYFKKAADKAEDDGSAAYLAGETYRTGNAKVKANAKNARAYFEKGAAKGHQGCKDKLGELK
jgi:TPR repeat protein